MFDDSDLSDSDDLFAFICMLLRFGDTLWNCNLEHLLYESHLLNSRQPQGSCISCVLKQVPSTETLTRKARRKKRRDIKDDKRPPKMKSSGDDSDEFLAGLEDTAPSNEVESQPNQSTGSPLNPMAMRHFC